MHSTSEYFASIKFLCLNYPLNARFSLTESPLWFADVELSSKCWAATRNADSEWILMSPTASAGQLKATQRGSHTSRTSTVTQVAQVLSIVTPSQKSHKSHKYCDTSTKNCHIVALVTQVTQVAQVLYCHCSNLLLGIGQLLQQAHGWGGYAK